MVKLVNRALMTTPTTGTGAITLGSAPAGYQTFAAAGVVDGDVVRYVIEDGVAFEIGTGVYTATGTTLTRTVSESSAQNAPITLSGSAVVFASAISEDILDNSNLESIETPTAISPNNVTITSNQPTLIASAYSPAYDVDARNVREFQLTTLADIGYDTPVFTGSVNADSVTVSPDIDSDTQFRWRCRDVASTGDVSGYSQDAIFTTPDINVNMPTLTVEGAPSSVEKSPTLTTSAFSTTPAAGDTHAATDWEVRKTSDNSLVYSSLSDAVNLLSIVVPSGILEVSTEYLFRARHVGMTYGAGPYVEVTATTRAVFSDVPLLAVASSGTSPFITVYNQEIDTFTKLADPASLPPFIGTTVAFSSDDTYMAVSHLTTPFITIYKRSGVTFTKLADPATLPVNNGSTVAFSSDDTYMAVGHSDTPFITIYKRSGDTFTKLADPASLPTGIGRGVAFSSDVTYMAVGHHTTPFITIYKRSGDTFTKLADPATLPTQDSRTLAFSSDNTYLAMASGTPYIFIYKRSGDTFTKLADPASLPPSFSHGVAFSSDATYLAVGHQNTPFITIYKRSGDTFTKLADPASLPTGTGRKLAFSSDDTYLAIGHDTTPFITIYKRSGDTFTKLADPATLPTGTGNGVAFSNTGFPQ